MSDYGIWTGQVTKAEGQAVGDTTNLPQNWTGLDSDLWESMRFQTNTSPRVDHDALGLSLAIQCADVKARDIAKSEMALWRRADRRWVEVEAGQHWLAKLLATRPNDLHSWTEFWRMVVLHFDLAQNAYILKVMNRRGEVQELLPVPTSQCRPRISTSGKLFYEIAATTEFDRARLGGYSMIVPSDQVIHLRGRMYDGLCGLSNTDLGRPLFALVSAISRFQQNLFGNDGRMPIVFESDSAMFGAGDQADTAFKRLKQQLTDRVHKMSAYGDPILLEAGYKAKIIAQSSRDAMTSDAFNGVVMRICGLMQTPPHKIFAYESVKYDNQAAADNQYANDCLIPIAHNIEEKFRNELLDEDERGVFYPEFDRMPMLAGDPKTLSDVLDKAVKNGGIEIDEYRERLPLNLSPLPNAAGQVRYVPVNMAVINRAGEIVQQAASGQSSVPDPSENEVPAESRGLRLVG